MVVLDMFSGVGWGVGAREMGLEEEGVEIMPEAVATRDAVGLKTAHDDVWTYSYERDAHEGHIASPPCQTFSTAGKGAGRKALDDVLYLIGMGFYERLDNLRDWGRHLGDDRTALVLVPLHAAWVERPRWIAWEQVPTVQPVWDAAAEELRHWGYSVWTGRLQAEQYGVPQTRKRSILIASLNREVSKPEPTHSKYYPRSPAKLDPDVEKWMSMAEALGWGLPRRPSPTVTGGGTETGGAEPIAHLSRYAGKDGWAYRSTTFANSARRPIDTPAPTIAFGHDAASARCAYAQARNSGPGAARTPRPLDEPSYTIRAQGSGSHPSGTEWVGEGSVRVQVHEAGLLQSFPADMPWQGTKTKQYLQVGNAVPPGLAIPVLGEATGLNWREANAEYRRKIYDRL